MNRTPMQWAVTGLGVSSAISQLVLLRELLGVYQGNELVLGILLGNWLALTGLGTWLAPWCNRIAPRSSPPTDRSGTDRPTRPTHAHPEPPPAWLPPLQVWIALVPLLQVVAVRLGGHAVFVRGAEVGLDATVWSSLIVLAPYTVASGLFLGLASRPAQDAAPARHASRVYLADCLGGVLGGAAFTFALVHWFDHLALLTIPAVLNLGLAAWTHRCAGRRRQSAVPLALSAGLVATVAWLQPDAATTAWQCRPDRLLFTAQSPYGRLLVSQSGGQLNFLENGLPLLSSEQIERAEEIAHLALAQRPQARDVLLLSGALSGTAREVLKHGVTNVTCVELDPAILEAGRLLLPDRLADPRLRVVQTDGRRYAQRSQGRYDAILVDMPPPATAQLNRYYTAEFFGELKRILKPEGIVAFGLGQYDNYVSPELARVLASARHTLRQAFAHVLLLPAGKVWFLGSDAPLTADVAAPLDAAGVPRQWLRRSYLETVLTPDRLAAVRSAADQPAPLNQDFQPVLYFLQLRHWLSQFDVWGGGGLAVLAGLAMILSLRLTAPGLAVFSAGFAGSGLEVVLLLTMQALFGSLYHMLGLVITVFMAGLAAGAWLGGRAAADRATPRGTAHSSDAGDAHPESPRRRTPAVPARRRLAFVALTLAACALALPSLTRALGQMGAASMPSWLAQIAIAGSTALLGILVGVEFPLACAVEGADPRSLAARLFAADFAGACAGAVLAGAVLIPLLGTALTCAVASAANGVAGLVLLCPRRGAGPPA